MVEEELGLSLESHEHPLKQGMGALIGSLFAFLACLIGLMVYPSWGLAIGAIFAIGSGAAVAAYHEKNRAVPAIVWNLGIAAVAFGFVFFILDYLFPTL